MRRKRIIVCADSHCGHRVGLTPPSFQRRKYAASNEKDAKFFKASIELWNYFEAQTNSLRPIDALFLNGDAIDGRGPRSGGTELLTTDRNAQVDIAKQAIEFIDPKDIVMTRGTPYHVGDKGEDYEDVLAEKLGAKIGDQEWVDVNGVIFDLKHVTGGSTIPHGQFTAIAKERLWNLIWTEHDEQPKADVIIRSHVHHCFDCGEPGWRAIVTPALQGMGSKYGSRICNGIVHFGFLQIDVYENGRYYWEPHIARVESQKAKVLKL